MQSCTSTNLMSVTLRLVSSLISRRNAASEVSPHLILPPGMPHLFDHLCVRIISTSLAWLKISAPTVASGMFILVGRDSLQPQLCFFRFNPRLPRGPPPPL